MLPVLTDEKTVCRGSHPISIAAENLRQLVRRGNFINVHVHGPLLLSFDRGCRDCEPNRGDTRAEIDGSRPGRMVHRSTLWKSVWTEMWTRSMTTVHFLSRKPLEQPDNFRFRSARSIQKNRPKWTPFGPCSRSTCLRSIFVIVELRCAVFRQDKS